MDFKLFLAMLVTLMAIQLSLAYEDHWKNHIVSSI